jgi:hypothetical protein
MVVKQQWNRELRMMLNNNECHSRLYYVYKSTIYNSMKIVRKKVTLLVIHNAI